jgi:DNA-binding MarR family transcriptional regulator
MSAPRSSPGKGPTPLLSLDEVVDAVLASSRALVAVSARSIAGVKGVTLPQYRMLVVLNGAPSNLSQLARALDVAPSTAMRMVDRLEAAGLVVRAPADNRRETRLELTPAGKKAVRTVTTRRRRDLRAVLERVPAEQHDQLAEAMAAFSAAADQLWPTEAAALQPQTGPGL